MYETTIKLKHEEIPAKINIKTGEINEIKKRPNNIPINKELWNPGSFAKNFTSSWNYLLDNLSDKEISIVNRMVLMARPNSNSLEPLNNQSSVEEIAEKFHIHRNSVNKMFTSLLKHGVYAEFKFGSKTGIKHYWVLNPYISFKGKTISKSLSDLFRETIIAELVQKDTSFF